MSGYNMEIIKEKSEQLLKIIIEKRSSDEINEKTYQIRKLVRELNPSETSRNAQYKDDLIIEWKRKIGYK